MNKHWQEQSPDGDGEQDPKSDSHQCGCHVVANCPQPNLCFKNDSDVGDGDIMMVMTMVR